MSFLKQKRPETKLPISKAALIFTSILPELIHIYYNHYQSLRSVQKETVMKLGDYLDTSKPAIITATDV